ncbi:MAG: hypothetical protein PSV35_01465 [bacterium]|nr:hypothetical protein [bacterium]
MINMSLKKVFIISFSVLSFSASAQNQVPKDFLIKQCRDLSEHIKLLVVNQGKKPCVEKLGLASEQLVSAAYLIDNDQYPNAKHELDNAVYTLQYAELSSCNHYIQISQSKFEAQKIKNYL